MWLVVARREFDSAVHLAMVDRRLHEAAVARDYDVISGDAEAEGPSSRAGEAHAGDADGAP
jgi:hypothetical protein